MIEKRVIKGWSPDLMEALSVISPYTWTFTVGSKSLLEINGHIDCAHKGVSGTVDKPVMVAFKVKIVKDGVYSYWIDGGTTGCNILNRADHYAIVPISVCEILEAGEYAVEIHGRSASTSAIGCNGLAEIKDGYNCIYYKVTEV